MCDEEQGNSTADSEELELHEKELFRHQIDEWLETYLDNCFSNLTEQEATETDEPEESLGE